MKIPYFGTIRKNNTGGEHDDNGGNWLPYTIAICSGVILYTLLNNIPAIGSMIGRLLGTVKPVIMGIVFAYLLNPLVVWIDKALKTNIKNNKIRNWTAIAIAFAVIILFAGVLLYTLIPQLAGSIMQFIDNINSYAEALNQLVNEIAVIAEQHNIDVDSIVDTSNNFVSDAVQLLTGYAGKMVGRSFSLGGDAFGILIGIILAIYFLLSKRMLLDGMDRLCRLTVREERYHGIRHFLARCNNIVTKFIIDDLVDALIVGVLNFLFMTVMKMPYAVLISVVVGITNLAPTFGPFVGAFIGGFVLLFADPAHTIPFLIFTLILQLCDGYIIKPKLFGDALGVPGVWMVSGIVVGGEMFGVIGILMAVPMVGIITFVYRDYINKLEARRKSEAEAAEAEEAKIRAELEAEEKRIEEADGVDNCD